MTRTLPHCGCACSATRLLGCHPSRCSPPLFHSHVRNNSTLGVRTACVASRVACVRAWSWLSHPRPPDRSQHGCTVGVLPGPTRVLPMPRQYGIGRRAPTRAVLSCAASWCLVVRRPRRRVDCLVLTFCYVFSHTPPRHGHDCGSVDLERNFAPLVAHHSLTRLFADFTSLHSLYC